MSLLLDLKVPAAFLAFVIARTFLDVDLFTTMRAFGLRAPPVDVRADLEIPFASRWAKDHGLLRRIPRDRLASEEFRAIRERARLSARKTTVEGRKALHGVCVHLVIGIREKIFVFGILVVVGPGQRFSRALWQIECFIAEAGYRALREAGIPVRAQYPVESMRLDLALRAPDGAMLDIEVDGELYHRSWDGGIVREDRLRNARLRELGWEIVRFWVYEIRDAPASCISRVTAWWHAHGATP